MNRPVSMVLDLGTSGVKCGLVGLDGEVLSQSAVAQLTETPMPGRTEQAVEGVWRAVEAAIGSCLRADRSGSTVRAIAITGPRGTFALLDKVFDALTPFITWQDRRAAALEHELRPVADEVSYSNVTGMRLTASAAMLKLVHVLDESPQLRDDARYLVTPQSLALLRLGADDSYADYSTAAHVGTFALLDLMWSSTICHRFNIPTSILPIARPAGTVVGTLSAQMAGRFGLPVGIPLVLAAADGICAELGMGVIDPGEVYAYLGTASAIAGPIAKRAEWDEVDGLIVMPGSEECLWRALGLGGAGGSAINWVRGVLGLSAVHDLDKLASQSQPGANRLLFLPTLAGATAPYASGAARGAYLGISLATGREDIARAALEGVAMEMKFMLDALAPVQGRPDRVVLAGGGSRSATWRQIIADVMGLPVLYSADPHAGLRGCSFYATAAIKQTSVRSLARQSVPAVQEIVPNRRHTMIYEECLGVYEQTRQVLDESGLDSRLSGLVAPIGNGS